MTFHVGWVGDPIFLCVQDFTTDIEKEITKLLTLSTYRTFHRLRLWLTNETIFFLLGGWLIWFSETRRLLEFHELPSDVVKKFSRILRLVLFEHPFEFLQSWKCYITDWEFFASTQSLFTINRTLMSKCLLRKKCAFTTSSNPSGGWLSCPSIAYFMLFLKTFSEYFKDSASPWGVPYNRS